MKLSVLAVTYLIELSHTAAGSAMVCSSAGACVEVRRPERACRLAKCPPLDPKGGNSPSGSQATSLGVSVFAVRQQPAERQWPKVNAECARARSL